jgi:glycine betaine/choline ABC-type transport system substrate-binding protein
VRRRRLASRVAAIALATAAAGCGSTNSAGGAASSATTATTPLPGQGRPSVTVGDTNTYPEQFILGALYQQALVAEGYSVSINRNIGPVDVRVKALQSGTIGVYPEYINVWDQSVAGYKGAFRSAHQAYAAGEQYALLNDMQLLDPTPFSDTGGLGVTVPYAVQNGLSTIGDLRPVEGSLTIGGPPQFQTDAPGLGQVEHAYSLVPASFKPLAVGAQYSALDQNTVQVAAVNTTDGQLSTGEYFLLTDPKHVFGWGNVVPVVSQKALVDEGPAFMATINEVSALLTQRVMRELNADVAVLNEDPVKVARQFLEAHHLVPTGQSS